MQKELIISLCLGLISGCASTYPCGKLDMGKCNSLTTNYQHSFSDGGKKITHDDKSKPFKFIKYSQVPSNNAPLVSPATIMRVWLTPCTDDDNIYHDQGYEYIITSKGHWLYANNSHNMLNMQVQNISLVSSVVKQNTNITENKTSNPNAVLNDYPAFNALENQSVPMQHAPIDMVNNVSAMAQQNTEGK